MTEERESSDRYLELEPEHAAPETGSTGFWKKLKKGLFMTHTEFLERLDAAVTGRGVVNEETLEYLEEWRPDIVVPVDYPGFNLRLSRALRKSNIPVCFYVSPQVWAWRKGRIHKIGRSVDHMMVLFEFEVELYEKIGTPVTHVGHPLFDSLAAERPQGNLRRDMNFHPKNQPRNSENASVTSHMQFAHQSVRKNSVTIHLEGHHSRQ